MRCRRRLCVCFLHPAQNINSRCVAPFIALQSAMCELEAGRQAFIKLICCAIIILARLGSALWKCGTALSDLFRSAGGRSSPNQLMVSFLPFINIKQGVISSVAGIHPPSCIFYHHSRSCCSADLWPAEIIRCRAEKFVENNDRKENSVGGASNLLFLPGRCP